MNSNLNPEQQKLYRIAVNNAKYAILSLYTFAFAYGGIISLSEHSFATFLQYITSVTLIIPIVAPFYIIFYYIQKMFTH